MPHPREPFEQPVHDRPRRAATRIGEETDAASVAFATEVVD
jgi:hypothetical protein